MRSPVERHEVSPDISFRIDINLVATFIVVGKRRIAIHVHWTVGRSKFALSAACKFRDWISTLPTLVLEPYQQ